MTKIVNMDIYDCQPKTNYCGHKPHVFYSLTLTQ